MAFEPDVGSMAAEIGIRRTKIESLVKKYFQYFANAEKYPAASKEHREWMGLADVEIKKIAEEMKAYNKMLGKLKKKVKG